MQSTNKLLVPLASLALLSTGLLGAPARAQIIGQKDPVPKGGNCSTVAFDVQCAADEIDADWCAEITVKRPNKPDIEITVPLLEGSHEDTIAADIADEINEAAGADDPASVEMVSMGADKVKIAGGTICAKVGRDGKNCGHIMLDFSDCSSAGFARVIIQPIPVPQIKCFILPFEEGFDYSISLQYAGSTVVGTASIPSGETVQGAAHTIARALQAQGINATEITGGVQIDPGAITGFTASIVSNSDAVNFDGSVSYGMDVEHNL